MMLAQRFLATLRSLRSWGTCLWLRKPWISDPAITFVVAALYYGIAWRYRMLDPRFIDWVLNIEYDLSLYLTSISYFRFSDWSFPITHFDSLLYPVGATITMADGIPLLAVPYKLLDRWLPPVLQYFGLWLFVCVWLQTLLAKRIMKLLGASVPAQWAGTLLVMASVQLAFATEHAALWGHWLILAAFYLAILPDFAFVRACLLVVVAQWVHPYLFLMVLAILCVVFVKHWRTPRLWLRIPTFFGCILLSSWVVGYFEFSGVKMDFHGMQADLSTFFNSGNTSSLLPTLPMGRVSWGGFFYLGLGGLLGVAALLIKPFVKRWSAPVHSAWLLFVCLLLAAYGFSTELMFLGKPVFTLPYLHELLLPFSNTTRAIGRFVWPLAYYLLLFGVRALDTIVTTRRASIALACVIVGIQIVDIGPWLYRQGRRDDLWKPNVPAEVPAEIAAQVTERTKLVVFVPPISRYGCSKRKPWGKKSWRWALFGIQHRLKTNSEFSALARLPRVQLDTVCAFTKRMWKKRAKHPEILFIRP